MAPRLRSGVLPADSPKRREYAIDGRDVPCIYCGGVPTHPIDVVPAEYKDGRQIHRSHSADLCLDCLRGLGIDRIDKPKTAGMVKARQEMRAYVRKEARDEMRANQLSILGDEIPSNAVTEG